MPYLVGIDEAGYGPNLGPLVVAASVWRVADAADCDLYKLLHGAVSAKIDPPRIAVADSKLLFRGRETLGVLETGVLAGLSLTGRDVRTWQQLWDVLGADGDGSRHLAPWYCEYDAPLPGSCIANELRDAIELLRARLESRRVQLLACRATAVFPGQLNDAIDRHGSKGAALSQTVTALLQGILRDWSDEPAHVVCDKHGGRNHYQPLLQQMTPDVLVEIRKESRAESLYCWNDARRRIEVCFQTGGERFLPTALASMTAKYLRELAMQAFNAYWTARVPGLRPTAGYPKDARRFKDDIARTQRRLKISDEILWRKR